MRYILTIACTFLFVEASSQENMLKHIGNINTLSANEIKSSRWSIGEETLDCDYANYNAYKTYLGPLGAKRFRLQAGWAKCEKVKGHYDFKWLDEIVDDALSRGVKPWLETSCCNPIYEGGGDAALAGGTPTSADALKAWDAWVTALVTHFKNRVNEWEIWNEPDISKKMDAGDIARVHERTADIITREQPNAHLIMPALASPDRMEYVDSLLTHLQKKEKLNYVDAISFHGYRPRPEDTYPSVAKIREIVKRYNIKPELWQGENGIPSTKKGEAVGAMTIQDWSEITQAKWDLLRMLGDMANGVDVINVFQISDMYYASTDHPKGLNSKGLLKSKPNGNIKRAKPAYATYQHTVGIFSGKIEKLNIYIKDAYVKDVVIYAYQKSGANGSAITLWSGEAKPKISML